MDDIDDGDSPLFSKDSSTGTDRANRERVRALLERAWKCELRFLGGFGCIDYVALRQQRIVGWVEIKSRPFESTRYETAFFAFRKWLSLMLAELTSSGPGIYVVEWTDVVRYVRVTEVDATRINLNGHNQPRSPRDIEPIIEIPLAQMRALSDSGV